MGRRPTRPGCRARVIWRSSQMSHRYVRGTMTRLFAISIVLAILSPLCARAADDTSRPFCSWFRCVDDYCPKPIPFLHCPPETTCRDDYCAKPIPLQPCRSPNCLPDDYCAKPIPKCLERLPPVSYSCGSPICPCNECTQARHRSAGVPRGTLNSSRRPRR